MPTDMDKALGLGADFTFDGKTYHVSPWTFGTQALYSRHVRSRAVEAVRELREYLTDEEYRDQLAQVSRDKAAGVYEFGSPLLLESMKVKDNLAYLLYLELRENHHDADLALARRMVEQDPEGVMRAVTEANDDPNSTGPRTTAAAGRP